ncbi:hypothetical protein KZX46_21715 (plasmid) [Polymorphobacter sp. PAMC 29334]|uniref:hypothetical protein n=1 Tax=Polymorphobacter sp. PAMC 29334 TaxID=2862331 RepID=UPI001C73E4FC|nr:hypothetical protein [Polymorphobacter sp. PAMC 29334]QYE37254.1 hypothetical protein KZX46_21715 [Polymorphobacter sp. PAMC 29334]
MIGAMTSAEAFETLATAVLRAADASYASLIHVGTNAAGRTVRSPVDGIGLRVHRGSRRLLLAQHTTTARRELRRKWLEPDIGDLPKAQVIAAAERARRAVDAATLILCSSTDPDEQLVRDVHAAAGCGLHLDIWPGSRIADFLDLDSEGQWIRERAFGIEAVRLSPSQAQEIGRLSLEGQLSLVSRADIVARSLDPALLAFARDVRGAGFVIGESGLGKSAALRRLGDRWLEDGGHALVLDHEAIERSATIDQAVASGLRRWAPSLDAGCGLAALSLATPEYPLLLILEDVNRSANPGRIVERLIAWSGTATAGEGAPAWRLLCPVWRGNSGVNDDRLRDHVLSRSLTVERFEPAEAIEAVLTRAQSFGVALTDLQAGDLAASLGDDPLLIGLTTKWTGANPSDAIRSYVAADVGDAADDRLLAPDLLSALESLAERMVESRIISPSWNEIRTWFAGESDGLAAIRRLVDRGRVVRLGGDGRLAYRHDRVRDHLLVSAMVRLVEAGRFTPDLWEEPYYAGLIGTALTVLPFERIDEAAARNPVAVFAALQDPGLTKERLACALAAATRWTASAGFNDSGAESRRSHALRYLLRTDGQFVRPLVEPFPRNFWTLEAQARNGDARAAASLCLASDPGVRNAWRDRIVEHALARHPRFVDDVATLLLDGELSATGLEGVLNLAGEIGDPRLCAPLADRWTRGGGSAALSSGWLWAVLRCCPRIGHTLADDVCRVWAALPSKVRDGANDRDRNPRWDVAGYTLPWGLARRSDPATLAFMIQLPKRYRGLSRIVQQIIGHIDDPDAILSSARASAAIDRRAEGSGGINIFRNDIERRWSPDWDGRALSPKSRAALQKVWRDRRTNRFDRRATFRIWSLAPTAFELAGLPVLEADKVLADHALRARLAAGDRTAIPLLADRLHISARRSAWWQEARRVGLTGLEVEVRRHFEDRRADPPETDDGYSDSIVAELLMDSRSEFAVTTIVANWEHIRTVPVYVLAALHLATPETIALAQAAVRESGEPGRMLEFLTSRWGIKTNRRPGVTELAQLQAIEPFLALIGEGQFGQMHLSELASAANSLNELEWRRQHLDPLLTTGKFGHCGSDRHDIYASLDAEAERAAQHDRGWLAIDHWFETREKELWQRSALLDLVADWAVDRGSDTALRVLCEAITYFGERPDLALFDRIPPALRHTGHTAVEACIYEVRRRSL